MATKINEINLKGIRGAKDTLKLPLNGKSVLLYGDNGTGKSSISDSLEWFFTDKVEHLSSLEIDLKEALRNAKIDASETSEVTLSFTNNKVDATKSIYYKKAKLVSEFNNTSEDFTKFFTDTKNENLILRFKNLTNFVDNTKTEKLKYLSEIIGFSEVSKKKEVLQKCYNAVKSEITKQNFEGQKSNLQRVLIDKIGASISQEQNFIDKLNEKNYIGVDNLLQNRMGKTNSSYLPTSGNLTAYFENDILIGNIRPYLKKIWQANQIGGTNGDVLVIHLKDKNILPRYLYQILADDKFFDFNMQNAKGAKMPRGNKEAILKYSFPVPPLDEQKRIVNILDKFEALTHSITEGLPKEITLREQQYEYYREQLIDFPKN
nr:restriction endonuclease subunit S [Moraxella osloensis]